jgi:hypothetical protein
MEMASSTISDLRTFVRRRDLLPDVNNDVERLTFSRYGHSDLASLDQFWIYSYGCREDVCHCNICPGCYIVDNGGSYFRLPSDVDQAVWLLFPDILVLVLLSMVIDYFNGCVRAHSLVTVAQIKSMGEPSLVFIGLWFGFLRLPSKIYKIVSWKKKEYEDLKVLLVSFRRYFVIDEDSLCIFTIYYLFQ